MQSESNDQVLKLAFVADGRAEHARRWIRFFADGPDKVILLSTYPCEPMENVDTKILPGLFRPGNAFVKSSEGGDSGERAGSEVKQSLKSRMIKLAVKAGIDSLIRPVWQRLSCSDILWQRKPANRWVSEFEPDLIHAFRIPNETFLLAGMNRGPKLASVWGQDFIFNCRYYFLHRWLTRRSLPKLDAITADCERDLRLAVEYGYQGEIREYFPGNGGVDTKVFHAGTPSSTRAPVFVYARGFGPYLRPDTLFSAFSILLQSNSSVVLKIVAPDSQHDFMHQRMKHFQIPEGSFHILPFQTKEDWASLLGEAVAFVSPSLSDGTPNGMLESMACGTMPIVGDIESIREWIDDGKNGLTFDPESVDELLAKMVRCVDDLEFRDQCAGLNRQIIFDRCDKDTVMPRIREFYMQVVAKFREG